jgi:UDP-GlcNAc:undecaprenyl-phosphate/decaprenyl-phosphate GlcNAc-1-phosphate transferase
MQTQQYLIYGYTLILTFALSLILTALLRRLALRFHIYDEPGRRKIHSEPVPLLGGVAIAASFYTVILGHMIIFAVSDSFGISWIDQHLEAFLGAGSRTKLIGILAGTFLIFLLGMVDDLKVLKPVLKFTGQTAAAFVLVISGIHLDLFVLSNPILSGAVTIFWIVLITNAMNFLDNMDGLCGGISVIAAFSFFLCIQPHNETLARFLLMVFAGAVAGFLYHNLNPARIFMGDAGAMFNGFLLATIAVIGTFHLEAESAESSRAGVVAPLLALSVPLFDIFSVVYLRIRDGQSIWLGDKRHFSHRLVDIGMSPRQAVIFIYLVAGVAGLGAALLPRLDLRGIVVILTQTAGVFLLIVLLMNAGGNPGDNKT